MATSQPKVILVDVLDTTFGDQGIVLTPTNGGGGTPGAEAVALQRDGKIVVGGLMVEMIDATHGNLRSALARYTPNGTLDVGFGKGGIMQMPRRDWDDSFAAVAIQPDAKIVAATAARDGSAGPFFTVVRCNTDGSLDADFGVSGVARACVGDGNNMPAAITLSRDGKILVAGAATVHGIQAFGLARWNQDGTLDTTFGENGWVTTAIGAGRSAASAIGLQSSGAIVAVGRVMSDDGLGAFGLARYTPEGRLDERFGVGGEVCTKVSEGLVGRLFGAAVQADDHIVVAGPAQEGATQTVMVVMRYGPNGALDASFGHEGVVRARIGSENTWPSSVIMASGGKIVIGGCENDVDCVDGETAFWLVRLQPNGLFDASFGRGGQMITRWDGGSNIRALALQADGKIVAVGNCYGRYMALARYLGG